MCTGSNKNGNEGYRSQNSEDGRQQTACRYESSQQPALSTQLIAVSFWLLADGLTYRRCRLPTAIGLQQAVDWLSHTTFVLRLPFYVSRFTFHFSRLTSLNQSRPHISPP